MSRIQPHLVEGQRLASPVEGEQRLGRVAHQRRPTILLDENHTIDNGQRLLEFVNDDNLPSYLREEVRSPSVMTRGKHKTSLSSSTSPETGSRQARIRVITT